MESNQCLQGVFFQLQKLKELLHFSKIYHKLLTKLQKPKNNNKLSEFVLIVYSSSINTHHFNNDVSTPASPQLFVFGLLTVCWHEILPHNTSKTYNFALLLFYMFLQTIKFWHQQFFSTFDLITHLALNHHQFPITPNYNLCHDNFVAHISWKTWFNSHSLFRHF